MKNVLNEQNIETKEKPEFQTPLPYRIAKSEFEKEYLENLLRWANGNVQRAAQKADRDRKGLYIMMAKYGINPARYRVSRLRK